MADGRHFEQKHCCFSYALSEEYKTKPMPDDCPGLLATGSADGSPEDGYYIEVCPRKLWLGKSAAGAAFCGLGPDLIVLHRDTAPTQEEYDQAALEADEDW